MKPLTKIQKFAKGKPCMLRIPGVCRTTPENEDTCLCHAPFPNRGGMRKHDHWGAAGCSNCHAFMDAYEHIEMPYADGEDFWLPAIHEWQTLLIEAGLMQVEGIEAQPPKILPRRIDI